MGATASPAPIIPPLFNPQYTIVQYTSLSQPSQIKPSRAEQPIFCRGDRGWRGFTWEGNHRNTQVEPPSHVAQHVPAAARDSSGPARSSPVPTNPRFAIICSSHTSRSGPCPLFPVTSPLLPLPCPFPFFLPPAEKKKEKHRNEGRFCLIRPLRSLCLKNSLLIRMRFDLILPTSRLRDSLTEMLALGSRYSDLASLI